MRFPNKISLITSTTSVVTAEKILFRAFQARLQIIPSASPDQLMRSTDISWYIFALELIYHTDHKYVLRNLISSVIYLA